MTDNRRQFGECLTRQLDERGITSLTAAAQLFGGVSHSSVRAWKMGTADPSLDNFQAIADGLHQPLWRVLVAAGRLDPPDGWKPTGVSDMPTRALLDELERRTKE